MAEIKIKYNRWTCSECNRKYSSKYSNTTLCPSCLIPFHRELAKRIGTEDKLIMQTKIDYNKYL